MTAGDRIPCSIVGVCSMSPLCSEESTHIKQGLNKYNINDFVYKSMISEVPREEEFEL